jgi:hypothetical protein
MNATTERFAKPTKSKRAPRDESRTEQAKQRALALRKARHNKRGVYDATE